MDHRDRKRQTLPRITRMIADKDRDKDRRESRDRA